MVIHNLINLTLKYIYKKIFFWFFLTRVCLYTLYEWSKAHTKEWNKRPVREAATTTKKSAFFLEMLRYNQVKRIPKRRGRNEDEKEQKKSKKNTFLDFHGNWLWSSAIRQLIYGSWYAVFFLNIHHNSTRTENITMSWLHTI